MKPLRNTKFTTRQAHQKLQGLFQSLHKEYLLSGEAPQNKNLSNQLRFEVMDMYFDFSRHWINQSVIEELTNLSIESKLEEHINALFCGDIVNSTENRSALHTALRANGSTSLGIKDNAVHSVITKTLQQMHDFSETIRNQQHLGYKDTPITDIVNIGVGGSDLGPKLITQALQSLHSENMNIHFWSSPNNDPQPDQPATLHHSLKPESTLFILTSKSFTTEEMLINANIAKNWFINNGGDSSLLHRHFVAVTANEKAANEWGITKKHIFPLWDWVGGRYSVWSAVGLSVMISIGHQNFTQLLAGAREMDEHFYHTPWQKNIPILMALIGIWYNNYCDSNTHAIIPYHSALENLPSYLQQLEMESNGKSIDNQGNKIDYKTAPVIWGGLGIKGQHSYHQLLHQGTVCCPIDFIGVANEPAGEDNNNFLLKNLLAQSAVLNTGKQTKEPHKFLDGNRPNTIILLKQLTPQAIGRLLALYEHKVFTQGVIWNINSFDQWGVEEGKNIVKKYQNLFTEPPSNNKTLDESTHLAVKFIQEARGI
jgi:glucose-6-phosphate isomerase